MNQIGYIKNWYSMSDAVVVKTLCQSIKQLRLNKNISQEELAKRSGVSRITISRMESSKAINLLTYVQLLRALENLELLNNLVIEPEISPILLMEQMSNYRKKATPRK